MPSVSMTEGIVANNSLAHHRLISSTARDIGLSSLVALSTQVMERTDVGFM